MASFARHHRAPRFVAPQCPAFAAERWYVGQRVPLGPHVPAWVELEQELIDLRIALDARNAYILDAWGNLWCAGDGVEWSGQWEQAISIITTAVRAAPKSLQRGGALDEAIPRRSAYLKSFAGVYVVLVRFRGHFEVATARRAVATALPNLEKLTLLLPPPDGPDAGGASGFGSA